MSCPASRRRRRPLGSALAAASAVGGLASALLLAGCTTDQAADVALYRAMLELGEDGDLEPALAAGEPLSLRKAAALVNATSERLAFQGEEFVRAVAERRRAVASFLPTVDLAPTFSFTDEGRAGENGNSSAGGAGSGGSSTSFDVPVIARVTLFDGFRNVNRFTSAEAEIENRRGLLLDLRETLLLDMVRTYYTVLVAERSVEVLTRSLGLQEERLRDIQGRQEAGVARPLDVYQTEAQVAATRVLLLDARNDVDRGRELLSFLVGLPVIDSPLEDGFEVGVTPSESELDATALAHRHDLAAAVAAADAARAEVDVAIGEYAPSVSLNLDYFLKRDTVPTDRDWAGLISLNLPIFSAGRIEANVQDAWAGFRQQVLLHHALRREILRDVAVARTDLLASAGRLAEIEVQVRAAREAYRQADGSYQVGLATNLERLIALDQQLNAELAQALELYRFRGLYATLLRASGQLTEGLSGVAVPPPPERPAPDSPFLQLGSGLDP